MGLKEVIGAAFLSLFLLTGAMCATTSRTADSFCLNNHPKRFTTEERLSKTDQEKLDAVKFNKYGEIACGWRP